MDVFAYFREPPTKTVPKDPSLVQMQNLWTRLTDGEPERYAIRKSGVGMEYGTKLVAEVNAVAANMVENDGTYTGTWSEDAPTLYERGISQTTITGNAKLQAAVAWLIEQKNAQTP